MFRIRNLILLWLARKAWNIALAAWRRRSARAREPPAPSALALRRRFDGLAQLCVASSSSASTGPSTSSLGDLVDLTAQRLWPRTSRPAPGAAGIHDPEDERERDAGTDPAEQEQRRDRNVPELGQRHDVIDVQVAEHGEREQPEHPDDRGGREHALEEGGSAPPARTADVQVGARDGAVESIRAARLLPGWRRRARAAARAREALRRHGRRARVRRSRPARAARRSARDETSGRKVAAFPGVAADARDPGGGAGSSARTATPSQACRDAGAPRRPRGRYSARPRHPRAPRAGELDRPLRMPAGVPVPLALASARGRSGDVGLEALDCRPARRRRVRGAAAGASSRPAPVRAETTDDRDVAQAVLGQEARHVVAPGSDLRRRQEIRLVERDRHRSGVRAERAEVAIVQGGVGVLLRLDDPQDEIRERNDAIDFVAVVALDGVEVGEVEQHQASELARLEPVPPGRPPASRGADRRRHPTPPPASPTSSADDG